MSPLTHALVGWMVANVTPLSRTDRRIITLVTNGFSRLNLLYLSA